MFSIGEFARHGRVSVRMLRHYDAIGLLEPAFVDPASGYRCYQAGQLSRLNRIIALKDLGFTLQQVASILDEQVSAAELRGMLMLRRAELQAQITSDTARLTGVEARLLSIDKEASDPAPVVVKRLEPMRVAELTGVAASYEPQAITPVIQPLGHDLYHRVAKAGVATVGPPMAYYLDADSEAGTIEVHAGLPIVGEPPHPRDFLVADLPEIPAAATLIHHGLMDHVLASIQALAWWIDAHGYQSLGYARELTLEFCGPRDEWVTELQQPITAK
jgi:DNA-binding transcriptional MerR regulator/effector-binding domain-containing protein